MMRYRLITPSPHKRFYSLLKQVSDRVRAYQRLLGKVVINLAISFTTSLIQFVNFTYTPYVHPLQEQAVRI